MGLAQATVGPCLGCCSTGSMLVSPPLVPSLEGGPEGSLEGAQSPWSPAPGWLHGEGIHCHPESGSSEVTEGPSRSRSEGFLLSPHFSFPPR
uniref:Uncharacterized protein n=1 Tax=Equus caballus TaxID=9796 RepID=A0A3Q2HCL0_HORSE